MAGIILQKAKRILEIFPNATETDLLDYYDMVEKYYGFNDARLANIIIKTTLGTVDFYQYSRETCCVLMKPAQVVCQTISDERLKFVEHVTIRNTIEQYVETGKVDYQMVLRDLYEKEKLKLDNSDPNEVIELKKELIKEGTLLIPQQYHRYFTSFPINKEGLHLAA